MKFLWAPWRLAYIKGAREKECIFCIKPKASEDKKNLILYRGKHNFVILNLYPYNNGHVMVVPYSHADSILKITKEETEEMMSLTQKCVEVLDRELKPHGYNIGMNIGTCAGAGIEAHIHMHIVPRWNGDTNYMPVVGKTKVMAQTVEATYDTLVDLFRGF
jgi:ATP adenylyltransferase